MGEPQVPTTFERSGRPAAAVGGAVCGRRPRGVCGGTVGSYRIGAKRRPCPQQPASSNSQPRPTKRHPGFPACPSTVREGAFVGEPQVPAAFERSGAPSQNFALQNEKRHPFGCLFLLVGEDGFEPSKSVTTDLQSAPFGRSGTPPYSVMSCGGGAGGRIRTPDLLITNQLLYRLSYTSVSAATILLYHSPGAKSSPKIQFFAAKQSGSRPTGQGAAVYSPSGRSQLSMCSSR